MTACFRLFQEMSAWLQLLKSLPRIPPSTPLMPHQGIFFFLKEVCPVNSLVETALLPVLLRTHCDWMRALLSKSNLRDPITQRLPVSETAAGTFHCISGLVETPISPSISFSFAIPVKRTSENTVAMAPASNTRTQNTHRGQTHLTWLFNFLTHWDSALKLESD